MSAKETARNNSEEGGRAHRAMSGQLSDTSPSCPKGTLLPPRIVTVSSIPPSSVVRKTMQQRQSGGTGVSQGSAEKFGRDASHCEDSSVYAAGGVRIPAEDTRCQEESMDISEALEREAAMYQQDEGDSDTSSTVGYDSAEETGFSEAGIAEGGPTPVTADRVQALHAAVESQGHLESGRAQGEPEKYVQVTAARETGGDSCRGIRMDPDSAPEGEAEGGPQEGGPGGDADVEADGEAAVGEPEEELEAGNPADRMTLHGSQFGGRAEGLMPISQMMGPPEIGLVSDQGRPFTFNLEQHGGRSDRMKQGTAYTYWYSARYTPMISSSGMEVLRYPQMAQKYRHETYLAVGSKFGLRGRDPNRYLVFLEVQVTSSRNKKKKSKGGPCVLCYTPWMEPSEEQRLRQEGTGVQYLRYRLIPVIEVEWATVIPGRTEAHNIVVMAERFKNEIMDAAGPNPMNAPSWSKGLWGLPIPETTSMTSSSSRDAVVQAAQGQPLAGKLSSPVVQVGGKRKKATSSGRKGPANPAVGDHVPETDEDEGEDADLQLFESWSKRGKKSQRPRIVPTRYNPAAVLMEDKQAEKRLKTSSGMPSGKKASTSKTLPGVTITSAAPPAPIDADALGAAIGDTQVPQTRQSRGIHAIASGRTLQQSGQSVPGDDVQVLVSQTVAATQEQFQRSLEQSMAALGRAAAAEAGSGDRGSLGQGLAAAVGKLEAAVNSVAGTLNAFQSAVTQRLSAIENAVQSNERRLIGLRDAGKERDDKISSLLAGVEALLNKPPPQTELSGEQILEKIKSYRAVFEALQWGDSASRGGAVNMSRGDPTHPGPGQVMGHLTPHGWAHTPAPAYPANGAFHMHSPMAGGYSHGVPMPYVPRPTTPTAQGNLVTGPTAVGQHSQSEWHMQTHSGGPSPVHHSTAAPGPSAPPSGLGTGHTAGPRTSTADSVTNTDPNRSSHREEPPSTSSQQLDPGALLELLSQQGGLGVQLAELLKKSTRGEKR